MPVGQLLRQLRYIVQPGAAPCRSGRRRRLREPASDESRYTPVDDAASPDARVDLTDIIEITREFVQRYEVSEQDFLDLILGGETTPELLAQKFGCSLREAEEVLEAADRVYLAESYELSGQPTQARKKGSGRSEGQHGEERCRVRADARRPVVDPVRA